MDNIKFFMAWFAGFFEDQKGSASSKRITLYWLMFMLSQIVSGSLNGKAVADHVLYAIVGLIAYLVGAVTAEFFKKVLDIKAEN